MGYKFSVSICIVLLFLHTSCSFIIGSTNYSSLNENEKTYLDTFHIENINDTVDYNLLKCFSNKKEKSKFKFEQIGINEIKTICSFYDTTLVYLATPWCGGYPFLTPQAIKWNDEHASRKNIKLLIVNDSYFLKEIRHTLDSFNFTQRCYILDNGYGLKIYKNLQKFTKNNWGFTKHKSNNTAFVFLNKRGEVIKSSLTLE